MMKQKTFASLTYKIGVMLNEASLFRSSYANTIPFLERISKEMLSNSEVVEEKIQFLPITAENIDELFIENAQDNLFTFDAIIVSTNSTQEDAFLKKIREHKDEFAQFVQQHRGIFILSQKKLSDSTNNTVDFLPEILRYKLIKRTDSTSSKDGKIKLLDSTDYLSRDWDDNKHEGSIDSICERNDFQTHRYRYYIAPSHVEQYIPLLTDENNKKDNDVFLLLRAKRYRVVISSMALDHEKQVEVIKSVLIYILKGKPTLAFVGKMNDNGFKSLYYNAVIDKINCGLYDSFDKIPQYDLPEFNVFIVHHSISHSQVETYWKKLDSSSCKIYHIQKYDDCQVLLEYSNTSEAEIVVDNACAWILSRADDNTADYNTQSTWRNNFWTSYDVLRYLHNYSTRRPVQEEKIYANYISTILERARKHFKDKDDDKEKEKYTYDGVFSCTCALLTMLLFDEVDETLTKAMPPQRIMATLQAQYRLKTSMGIHFSDCVIYKLMMGDIENTSMLKNNFNKFLREEELDLDVGYEVKKILGFSKTVLVEKSEAELSNYIGILYLALKHGKSLSQDDKTKVEDKIKTILNLMNEWQENGLWKRISQTAKILTDLQMYITNNVLLFADPSILSLAEMIINSGINFLVSSCRENRQWNDDVLSTTNAANALLLYTESNNYTIRDFRRKFSLDFTQLEQHDEIVDNIRILSKSYAKIAQLNKENTSLKSEKQQIADEHKQFLEEQESLRNKYKIRLLIATYVASFSAFIALFIQFGVFDEIKNVLSIVCSILFGGVVTSLVDLFVRLEGRNKKRKNAKADKNNDRSGKKKKNKKENKDEH